jgi:hypothetical protein
VHPLYSDESMPLAYQLVVRDHPWRLFRALMRWLVSFAFGDTVWSITPRPDTCRIAYLGI